MAWTVVSDPLNFQRTNCKKEPEEVHMVISTNSDSFAITYLI